MSKLQTPFRYDFVGSFLRPQALKDAKAAYREERSPRRSSTKLLMRRLPRSLKSRRNLDSMRSQMASSEEHSGILTLCGDLMELPMRTLEMV